VGGGASWHHMISEHLRRVMKTQRRNGGDEQGAESILRRHCYSRMEDGRRAGTERKQGMVERQPLFLQVVEAAVDAVNAHQHRSRSNIASHPGSLSISQSLLQER